MTTPSGKYGFDGGISLPKMDTPAPRQPAALDLDDAVKAGAKLGFVDREPVMRRKPGPKRREPQDKMSIPGPKRVIDRFRAFCIERDITLWQGVDMLLTRYEEDPNRREDDTS